MSKSFQDEIQSNIKDDYKKLMLNILYTAGWIENILSPIFKNNSITNAQYNILRILKGSSPKPLSVGEIKNRIMFKRTDITRMIDRLVEKELVCRELCENNRRRMDITISPKGEQLLKKMSPELEEVEKLNLVNISTEDVKNASMIIDKLRGWEEAES